MLFVSWWFILRLRFRDEWRGETASGIEYIPPDAVDPTNETSNASTSAPPRCPVCASQRWTVALGGVLDYISGERFDVLRCDECGLGATCPAPPEDRLAGYYPPRYRTERQRFTASMRTRLRARALESRFKRGFRGRLLDYGCGDGTFALAMKARGWDVAVTELDQATLDRMRLAGLDAYRADAVTRTDLDRQFDAITSWHVQEHVARPEEVVRWVKRALVPGGVFQVTVPNFASWQSRLTGAAWLHLDVPRHLYHFTPSTAARLLTDNGFAIEKQTRFALEYDWFGVAQSILNKVCDRPNVWFERLTSPGHVHPASRRDVIASNLLGPPISAMSLPMCLADW
ncbi:MAG: class I SAM-dependent methyltransferase, partial [Tepidisphaeraceae bacterium]